MRRRGRGIVLVVIVAMLTPALADADNLGGLNSQSIAVDSPGDLPVVPTIIMADCFCGPNASINKQAPNYVGSGLWDSNNGWVRQSRQLRPPVNGFANRLAFYDSGKTDIAVEATLIRTDTGSQLGVMVRANAVDGTAANAFRLVAYLRDDRAYLVAWAAGARKTLADVAGLTPPATTRLRMEIVGSDVRVLADGVVLIDMALPSPLDTEFAAFTFAGLYSEDANDERIDDVLVTTWPP
jgi:hypothetical protein